MPIQIQVSLHNHLPALKNERSIKNIRRNIVVRTRNSIDDEFCPFLTQILSGPPAISDQDKCTQEEKFSIYANARLIWK